MPRPCVFQVRAFVAVCPKCGTELENPEGEREFNEVECPLPAGTVVTCECGTEVQVTNPDSIWGRKFRGAKVSF